MMQQSQASATSTSSAPASLRSLKEHVLASRKKCKLLHATQCHPDLVLCLSVVGLAMLPVAFAIGTSLTKALESREVARNKTRRAAFIRSCRASIEVDPRVHDAFIFWSIELALNFGDRDLGRFTPKRPLTSFSLEEWDIYRRECSKKQARNAAAVLVDNMDASKIPIAKVTTPPVSSDVAIVEPKLSVDQSPPPSESKDVPAVQSTRNKNTIHIAPVSQSTTSVPIKTSISQFATLRIISSRKFTPTYTISPSILPATISMNISILKDLVIPLPIVPSPKINQTISAKRVIVLFKIVSSLSTSRLQVAWAVVFLAGKWFIVEVLVSDTAIRGFPQSKKLCYCAPLLLEASKPSAFASRCVLLSLCYIPKPKAFALPKVLAEKVCLRQIPKYMPHTSFSPISLSSSTSPSASPIFSVSRVSPAAAVCSVPSSINQALTPQQPLVVFKIISTLSTSRVQVAWALVSYAGNWFIFRVVVSDSSIQGFMQLGKISHSAPLLLEAAKPSVVASRRVPPRPYLNYIPNAKPAQIPTALLAQPCLPQIFKSIHYISFSHISPILFSSSTLLAISPVSPVPSISSSPSASIASTVCSEPETSASLHRETISDADITPLSTPISEHDLESSDVAVTVAAVVQEPESDRHSIQDSCVIQPLEPAKRSVLTSPRVLRSLGYTAIAKPVSPRKKRAERSPLHQASIPFSYVPFSPVLLSSSTSVLPSSSEFSDPPAIAFSPLLVESSTAASNSSICPATSICPAHGTSTVEIQPETIAHTHAPQLLIHHEDSGNVADCRDAANTLAAADDSNVDFRHDLQDSISFNPWAAEKPALTIDTTSISAIDDLLSPTLTSPGDSNVDSTSPVTPISSWDELESLGFDFEPEVPGFKEAWESSQALVSHLSSIESVVVGEEGSGCDNLSFDLFDDIECFPPRQVSDAIETGSPQTRNEICGDFSFDSIINFLESQGPAVVLEDDVRMNVQDRIDPQEPSPSGDNSMTSLFGEEDDPDASGVNASQFEMWVDEDEQDCRLPANECMAVDVSATTPSSPAANPGLELQMIDEPSVPYVGAYTEEDVCMLSDMNAPPEDTEMASKDSDAIMEALAEQPDLKATVDMDVEMGSRDPDDDVEMNASWNTPRYGVPIILSKLALPGTKPRHPPPAAVPTRMEVVLPQPPIHHQNVTPVDAILPKLGDPFAFSLNFLASETECLLKAPETAVDLTWSAPPSIATVPSEDDENSSASPSTVVLPVDLPSLAPQNNSSSEPVYISPLDLLADLASIAELCPQKAPGTNESVDLTCSIFQPAAVAFSEEAGRCTTSPASTVMQPSASPSPPIQNPTPSSELAPTTLLESLVPTEAVETVENAVELLLGLRHLAPDAQETSGATASSKDEAPASAPSSASAEEWTEEDCEEWDDLLEEALAEGRSARTANDLATFDAAAEELHRDTEKLVQKTQEWEASLPAPTFTVLANRWDDNEIPAFDVNAMKRHHEDGDLPDCLVATLEQEETALEASDPPSNGRVLPSERKIRALPIRRTRIMAPTTTPPQKEEANPPSNAVIDVIVVNGIKITTDEAGDELHDNGEGEILCY